MHNLIKDFNIFSDNTSGLDIRQGSLGYCYLLIAYISLANRKNESAIRDMFVTKVIYYFIKHKKKNIK